MNFEKSVQDVDLTLYLDRWIAVVRGRVIGVGLTADQAHRAAKQTRPKEKAQILFVDANGTVKEMAIKFESDWGRNYPPLPEVIDFLQMEQIETYLVGGPVRDLLLEREHIADLDFVGLENGLMVARRVADALGAAYYPLDEERGVGRVVCESQSGEDGSLRIHLDFATIRGETLLADLQDRDFTINAIAINLTGPSQLIDPLQGQRDLEIGQIKAVSPVAFQNDPVRVIRAVRQAIEFNFSIEVKTGQHLQQAAPILTTISPERKRDELLKLLNTTAPGRAVQLLDRYQVLSHLLPEVETTRAVSQGPPHHLDVFDHTARALDAWADMLKTGLQGVLSQFQPQVEQYLDEELAGNLTRRQLIPLALLWHDVGKPLTRTATENKIQFIGHERRSAQIARRVMKEFRFSNQAVEFVGRVIANHMRPLLLAADGGKISRRAIYRYFQATDGMGEQTGVAVVLHALADHRATYPPNSTQEQTARKRLLAASQQLITAYFDKRDQVVDPAPLLAGRDLIEIFGLPQGQLIGLLLTRLKEAQATGQVADRASALDFIENDPDFIKNRSKSDV